MKSIDGDHQDDEDDGDAELRELLKDIIKNSEKFNDSYKKQAKIDNALLSTIKEFLDTFLVLGYDLEGSPVIMRNTSNQMQDDALQSLLIKYFSYNLRGHQE